MNRISTNVYTIDFQLLKKSLNLKDIEDVTEEDVTEEDVTEETDSDTD